MSFTWIELKAMLAEFLKEVSTMNPEELDNAFKCLSMGYLNLAESDSMWQRSAEVALCIGTRAYEERFVALATLEMELV